jgi:hypothetical protein
MVSQGFVATAACCGFAGLQYRFGSSVLVGLHCYCEAVASQGFGATSLATVSQSFSASAIGRGFAVLQCCFGRNGCAGLH